MRLFRIIDRYVFAEAFGLFLLGFFGFLGFLVVNKLFLEVQDLIDPRVPAMKVVLAVMLEGPRRSGAAEDLRPVPAAQGQQARGRPVHRQAGQRRVRHRTLLR